MDKAHDEHPRGSGGSGDELIDPLERGVEKEKDGLADYIIRGQQQQRNSLQVRLYQPNASSELFSPDISLDEPDSPSSRDGELPSHADDRMDVPASESGPQWTAHRSSSPDSSSSLFSTSPDDRSDALNCSSSSAAFDDGEPSSRFCTGTPNCSSTFRQPETTQKRQKPYPPINFTLTSFSTPDKFLSGSQQAHNISSSLYPANEATTIGKCAATTHDRCESVPKSTTPTSSSSSASAAAATCKDHQEGDPILTTASPDDGKPVAAPADRYGKLYLDLFSKVPQNQLPDLGEKSLELERVLESLGTQEGVTGGDPLVTAAVSVPDPKPSFACPIEHISPKKMEVTPSFPLTSQRNERVDSESPDSTFWTGDDYDNVSSGNSDILLMDDDRGCNRDGKYQDGKGDLVSSTSRICEPSTALVTAPKEIIAEGSVTDSRPQDIFRSESQGTSDASKPPHGSPVTVVGLSLPSKVTPGATRKYPVDSNDVRWAMSSDVVDVKTLENDGSTVLTVNSWAELRSGLSPDITSVVVDESRSALSTLEADAADSSSSKTTSSPGIQTVAEEGSGQAASSGASAKGGFLFGVPYKDISRSFEYSMQLCSSVPEKNYIFPILGTSRHVGGHRADQDEEDSGIELTQNIEEEEEEGTIDASAVPFHVNTNQEQIPSHETTATGLAHVIPQGSVTDLRQPGVQRSSDPSKPPHYVPVMAVRLNSSSNSLGETVNDSTVNATTHPKSSGMLDVVTLQPTSPGIRSLGISDQNSLLMGNADEEMSWSSVAGDESIKAPGPLGVLAAQNGGAEPSSSGRSSTDISVDLLPGFATAAADDPEVVEIMNDSDVLYIAEVPPVGTVRDSEVNGNVPSSARSPQEATVVKSRIHTRSYSVRIEEENKRVLRSSTSQPSLKASSPTAVAPEAPGGRKFRTGSPILAALRAGCPPPQSPVIVEELPKKGKKRTNPDQQQRPVTRAQARKAAEQKQQGTNAKKPRTG